MKLVSTFFLLASLTMTLFVSGCGKPSAGPKSQAKTDVADHKAGDSSSAKATAKLDHSGWWCKEHGVPEGECGQCSSKLAKQFQKDGDWCKEHDRPDSQCFICHPEKEAMFAAKYEAKYGKKPPKPLIN
ncbi:MAG: hypothetical protein JWP89_423 [Schlesneria sp.]|nr:hypothetical protein [Schlesneria sp.]